jgi:Xaa-Pro dipeptidase
MPHIYLSDQEFKRRRRVIGERLVKHRLEGLCLFSPTQVFYLTGFAFIATERPIGAIYDADRNEITLFVPLLEAEHAQEAHVEHVRTYDEYPGVEHPMIAFAALLSEMRLSERRLGTDSDGYAGGFGYEGPPLSGLISGEVVGARDLIERLMWIKSCEEIALIRESCRWGDVAHRLLQRYTAPGLVETDVSFRASHEASMQMIAALGSDYRAMRSDLFPAFADYRGQIGSHSAVPHSIGANLVFHEGDVVVTGAASEIGGYLSELERTMILGKPTQEQRRYYGLMLQIQDLAFRTIRPGARCCDVDRTVLDAYKQRGIMPYWRHHTGHSLGYGMHEAPFLDIGNEAVIEPGMVFSVEPGIYVPGLAGFRHSDTVLVTDDGTEVLTSYPRDLESLTLPV